MTLFLWYDIQNLENYIFLKIMEPSLIGNYIFWKPYPGTFLDSCCRASVSDAYSEAKSITERYAKHIVRSELNAGYGCYLLTIFWEIHLVKCMVSICFALGNKSGSFCEAVNCERSEQEGKFLFAI